MPRVLVVDDDLGTLDTCEAILRCTGLDVETAACGRRALDVLQREPCDLLLTDLKLPDISGLEVLADLRRRGSTIPTVIMTGYASVETSVRAMKLGAVDYLVKPVFDEDIVAAVRRGLGLKAPSEVKSATTDSATAEGRLSHRAPPRSDAVTAEPTAVADGLAQWAAAMSLAINARRDLKTTAEWAALVCVAPATLRGWCRVADLRVKESLDLARVLRAVSYARRLGSVVGRFLNVQDHHTLDRLLGAAGIRGRSVVPTLEEVLARQMLIRDPVAVKALRDLLLEPGGTPESS